ncbi:MAG: DUF1565 domain-containing protein [Candidatus Krumholzibacteria bacterium]|nr:DUF1565 domain-containing protein [Candidatus Krumholzibacteria bacterium]
MDSRRLLTGIGFIAFLALSACSDDSQKPSAKDDDPVCAISVTSIDYGSREIGSDTDLSFDIENIGTGTLSGTAAEASGDFSIVGDPAFSLGEGEIRTIVVRFSPASIGPKVCTVSMGTSFCDSVHCAGVGDMAGDYFVDADAGLDTNPGTSGEPWRTITHAIAAAGANTVIRVLPGTYDAAHGETFPLILLEGQILIGDIAGKGEGAEKTAIYGSGTLVPSQGSYTAAIQSGEGSTVAGFSIGAPYAAMTFGIFVNNDDMTVAHNTFTSETTNLYGGVRPYNTGTVEVADNDFRTSSYGVYATNWFGTLVVEENEFENMSIPVDVSGIPSDVFIRGNRIVGGGQNGIQIQSGTPLIENNVFDHPGGFANYGAIRCQNEEANPTIRGNTFICARGVRNDNGLSPDLGTAGDFGGNDFTGVTGASVYHMGDAVLYAIGNIWPHAVPICGTDIAITSSGTVIWGTDAGEQCP